MIDPRIAKRVCMTASKRRRRPDQRLTVEMIKTTAVLEGYGPDDVGLIVEVAVSEGWVTDEHTV